jgi:hypothetical protein
MRTFAGCGSTGFAAVAGATGALAANPRSEADAMSPMERVEAIFMGSSLIESSIDFDATRAVLTRFVSHWVVGQ